MWLSCRGREVFSDLWPPRASLRIPDYRGFDAPIRGFRCIGGKAWSLASHKNGVLIRQFTGHTSYYSISDIKRGYYVSLLRGLRCVAVL